MQPAQQSLGQPIRVMLVDDHQTMLWGLERLISAEAPRMQVAGTARCCDEAVSRVREVVPDVVLLDLDLGGQSALDIIPAMVANAISRVLVLTAEREQKTLDKAVRQGARGVLRKDANAEQVIKAIEKTHEGEYWLPRETLNRVFSEVMNPAKSPKQDPEVDRQACLTGRERKIIEAVVKGSGALNKTLAGQLFISEHTLRNHLTSIYQKLGLNNRLELYVYAMKHGL
jgi:two-component system, NarL family, nitrate/nitrite response regulator NarL